MDTDLPFAPVPVRARRDGWTPARQAAFVVALRQIRRVVAACRVVGMSWQTAYRLRSRPDAGGFAAAWDAALAVDLSRPVSGRAIDGTPTPVSYRGKRIGERRRHDNRLAMYLLQLRRPALRETDRKPRQVDTAVRLEAALAVLAHEATLVQMIFRPASRDDVARMSSPSGPLSRPPSIVDTSPTRDAATRPAGGALCHLSYNDRRKRKSRAGRLLFGTMSAYAPNMFPNGAIFARLGDDGGVCRDMPEGRRGGPKARDNT